MNNNTTTDILQALERAAGWEPAAMRAQAAEFAAVLPAETVAAINLTADHVEALGVNAAIELDRRDRQPSRFKGYVA